MNQKIRDNKIKIKEIRRNLYDIEYKKIFPH